MGCLREHPKVCKKNDQDKCQAKPLALSPSPVFLLNYFLNYFLCQCASQSLCMCSGKHTHLQATFTPDEPELGQEALGLDFADREPERKVLDT